jgi:hypothetical protein
VNAGDVLSASGLRIVQEDASTTGICVEHRALDRVSQVAEEVRELRRRRSGEVSVTLGRLCEVSSGTM